MSYSQYPEGPEDITANMLKLTELTPNPYVLVCCMTLLRVKTSEGRRVRFIFKCLISKLHEFVSETKCVLRYHHIPILDVNVINPGCLSRLSPFPIHYYSITTEEWNSVIELLSRTGQESTAPFHDEFDSLLSALGVSALMETLNNPRVGNATESSFLGPYFTEDAPDRSSRPISSLVPNLYPLPYHCSSSSLDWGVDRVGGKGRVHVCRGKRAHH